MATSPNCTLLATKQMYLPLKPTAQHVAFQKKNLICSPDWYHTPINQSEKANLLWKSLMRLLKHLPKASRSSPGHLPEPSRRSPGERLRLLFQGPKNSKNLTKTYRKFQKSERATSLPERGCDFFSGLPICNFGQKCRALPWSCSPCIFSHLMQD